MTAPPPAGPSSSTPSSAPSPSLVPPSASGPADPPAPVDADLLRAVGSRLPAGVVVVTARWRGLLHAATVSTFVPVSLEPPLVLVCLHTDSRLREALDEVPGWSVSVLAQDGGPVADWVASPGRPAFDGLARVPHADAPWSGGAWLDGAAAWFDVRTVDVHPAGDHDVVVGEVVAARAGDPARGGLVHLRGRTRPVV
ncbi:flavin reductase family protein [Cellulomonas endophytica]|uniref:flavin reductase family protein n=1 Tax=Cellulomonas endophytica TaxID=2494735 RepID=UPI001F0B9449|nr:flavin reductase family protein [Cellulomonas endophytica]